MTTFLHDKINSTSTEFPNCFAFKLKVDDDYKVCICPRINNKWSELDIFYVPESGNQVIEKIEHDLDPEFFNVIFLTIRKNEETNSLELIAENPQYLKSKTLKSINLYNDNKFFELVEYGYQKCIYDIDPSDGDVEIIHE
jgi:hypothetical protein